jgi:hypothetical protein
MIEVAKIIGAVLLVIVAFYVVVAGMFGVGGWIMRAIKRDHSKNLKGPLTK